MWVHKGKLTVAPLQGSKGRRPFPTALNGRSRESKISNITVVVLVGPVDIVDNSPFPCRTSQKRKF